MMKIQLNKPLQKTRLVLAVTMLLSITGCKEKAIENDTIRPVFYEQISTTAGGNQFTIPGIVQYGQEAKMSFKVGGVINNMNVAVGQKVSKGGLLAALDGTDYQVTIKQAEASQMEVDASVQNAQIQLINAKSNYLRMEKLYLDNYASLSDFENAKAQYESAQAGLEAVKSRASASNAQVSATKNQLNYTRLIAPINGTVSQIFMEENEMIGAGVPVMVLSSDDNYEVQTNVPETWISQLNVGHEVEVSIASIDKKMKGEIKEITPNAPANAGYPVKIAFAESSADIKSGMSVKVNIPNLIQDANSQIILVDIDAVSKDADGFFVFVLEKNNNNTYTAIKRKVEVGDLTKNGYIIQKGLENNEVIATAGIRFLYDGQIVKLMEQLFE